MPTDLSPRRHLVLAARSVADLVLPARCAGCGAPGAAWCRACRTGPGRVPLRLGVDPACWSAAPLDDPLRALVTAHKDGGRRDARAALVALLAVALTTALAHEPPLRAALAAGEPVLVVPVPPAARSRRRRGGDPVGALVEQAARAVGPGLLFAPVLRHTRAVADQAHLGRVARRANLAGAHAVVAGQDAAVAGRRCLVADDVLTTGVTLAEAARALRAAGAVSVVGATVAATPRSARRDRPVGTSVLVVGDPPDD